MDDFIKRVDMLNSTVRKAERPARVSGGIVQNTQTRSFEEVLESVKFSKHAAERMISRDIKLSDTDYARIEKGLGLAKQKGIRQTLIMMDNKIFIASVKNNTIITASAEENLKENVFTNIDGAVIV